MQSWSILSLLLQPHILLLASHPSGSLQTPQFIWTGSLSLHIQYDPVTNDTIILHHANTVPGVVVTCLFQGIFQKEINGSTVISGCRDDPVVHVTIRSKNMPGRNMFIIRGNLTEEVVSAYIGSQNEEGNVEVKRSRRSTFIENNDDQYDYDDSFDYAGALPTDLVLKMRLAYDETIRRHLGSDAAAQRYIAEVVTHAKEYFKDDSLGTNIFFHIQGPPQLLPNKELNISQTSFKQVQEVKIQEKVPLNVFCYVNDDDLFMGVSKRGKACDASQGISLTKWRCNVLKAAQTFAHESGHMNGLYHDEWVDDLNRSKGGLVTDCSGKGIMSDSTLFENRPNTWSLCSKSRFAKWFGNYGKQCLATVNPCGTGSGLWSTPCKCGDGATPSLCVSGHTCCEHSTATCLGEPSDIVKLYGLIEDMKSDLNKIRENIHAPTLATSKSEVEDTITTILIEKGIISCENETQCDDNKQCLDQNDGMHLCQNPCERPEIIRCDVPYSECVTEEHEPACYCKEDFHGNGTDVCIPAGFETEENKRGYKMFDKEYVEWDKATAKCASLGARLPVLSDLATINIVKKYLETANFSEFEQWDRSSRRVWLGLQHDRASGLLWVDGQRIPSYPASTRLFVWESRRLLNQEVTYADSTRHYGFYIDGDIAKLPGMGRKGAAVLCELIPDQLAPEPGKENPGQQGGYGGQGGYGQGGQGAYGQGGQGGYGQPAPGGYGQGGQGRHGGQGGHQRSPSRGGSSSGYPQSWSGYPDNGG